MKAIIPAAGLGTRLRPHTLTRPKSLLHVAGKPILAHILDELIGVGVRAIVLVVGAHGDQVVGWVREHYDLHVDFVEQAEALGNGHAVYVAREYLDDEPALIIFGDTIVRAHLPELVAYEESVIAVKPVPDPRRFGVVEVDGRGRVVRIVEKPEHPASDLAVVGLYLIRRPTRLRAALERMISEDRRMRGEFWLADALQMMLDAGEPMGTFPITHWYDCGTVEALLEANRDLLELDPPPLPVLPDAVVLAPSFIGPDARITGSVVGPHASVGARARITRSVVRDAVIHPGAVIEDAMVSGSVIGEGARITGRAVRPRGDRGTVSLP